MPTQAPERPDKIITSWLEGTDPIGGWESPAGPLFLSGKYAEYEITEISASHGSINMTTCGWCTGSFCDGRPVHCF